MPETQNVNVLILLYEFLSFNTYVQKANAFIWKLANKMIFLGSIKYMHISSLWSLFHCCYEPLPNQTLPDELLFLTLKLGNFLPSVYTVDISSFNNTSPPPKKKGLCFETLRGGLEKKS